MTSLFHLNAGLTSSFGMLCAMRIFHGALSSATNPLSYSLVADYFPPEKRGTPNAILSTGNFIGIALSSISILLIKNFGWRQTYGIMGGLGIMAAFFSLFMVTDPRKKIKLEKYDKKTLPPPKDEKRTFKGFLKNMKNITKIPTCKNVLIAGGFRSFGSTAVSCYIPVFF